MVRLQKEGVYAGGDAVTGAATVILAMGAGKAGARGIDEYIKSKICKIKAAGLKMDSKQNICTFFLRSKKV